MSKLAGWILAIYVLAVTGIAAYEYAVIDRLNWVIQVLMSGTAH